MNESEGEGWPFPDRRWLDEEPSEWVQKSTTMWQELYREFLRQTYKNTGNRYE